MNTSVDSTASFIEAVYQKMATNLWPWSENGWAGR